MRIRNKFMLSLLCFVGASIWNVPTGMAYGISAVDIYKQASRKNENYLRLLKRYQNAIDLTDRDGNTAYCLALKNDDVDVVKVLEKYGANRRHGCVKKVVEYKNKVVKKAKNNVYGNTSKRSQFKDDEVESYLWLGLGGVAIAGGALALSGGGGGGSSNSSDGDYCHSCDINKGKGGNPDGSAELFKTDEYKNSSYLCGSLAAEAYSYIYSKDENGNLVSHQANSTSPLKHVKVGVIDSGVSSANSELIGKVHSGFDANDFNGDGDIWGYDAGNTELYLYKKDGVYYPLVMIDGEPHGYGLKEEGTGKIVDITEDWLYRFFDYIREHLGISVSKDDFFVLNGAEGGAPGSGSDSLLDELGDNYSIAYYKVSNINHGSHVAGIIAGNKDGKGNHGVAFENAEIIAGSWDFENDIEPVIRGMVDGGATVLNHSWGYNAEKGFDIRNAKELLDPENDEIDTLKAYAYAAKNGAVWVQVTGNDGHSQPSIHIGMNTLDLSKYGYDGAGKYEVPLLAVTALDGSKATDSAPSGIIASYANRCGLAKDWCIAAEGTNILSSNAIPNGSEVMSGTSMAGPVVSGSIALLQGYYPWLKAQNIAYILLETANDKGAYANSDIYGKGALDLEAAVTTPIGGLGLAENKNLDTVKSVSLTKLSTSSVMQNQLLKAMPKTVTAFDALKRPFQYETSKLINTTHSSNANLRNALSRMAIGDNGVKTIKDERTGFQFRTSQKLNNGGNAHLSTAEVINETDEGVSRFYYAENSKYMKQDDAIINDNNPYLAMREAYGAENTLNLSETSKLKLSLQTGENGLYERDEEQDHHSFDERSYAMSAEYSFNLTDYLEVATLGGMLFEEDAMLGLNGVGGFGIKDSSTYYMGLKAKLDLTSKMSLIAAYYRGYTSGSDSSMLSISNLETESFMLAGEYSLNRNHKFGLMFTSPMSVVKGNASIMYASGRDNNSNNAYLNQLKTSLKPEAKEYDLGMYYKGKPAEDLNLSGKVEARFNADGNKGMTDYIGIVGAQYNF